MTRLTLFLMASLVILGSVLTSSSKVDSAKKRGSRSHHYRKHRKHSEKTDLQEEPHEIPDEGWNFENKTAVDTRRILFSKETEKGKRPYMVYLQLTKESAKAHKYRGWLCGGVIVDKYYILTSAACVEDADRFYIVSGTTKFVDSFDHKDDECVCKHRRKAVWKCVPKNYKFDFEDSIKWSSNDIAIVKVNKAFKFGVKETGCEFAVGPIAYNNISRELEKPGTKAWIAGWGSGNNFREGVYRSQTDVHIPKNAKNLQEAKVCIMDNELCAKKWAQRFREIITEFMICTRDVMKRLSEVCDKRYANCTDIEYRRHEDETPTNIGDVDLGRHLRDPNDYTARRSSMQGGFCENDHGGPLIVRHKGVETVIGVISACKIDPKTHSCHGPFLYTSIHRNRQFISCSIHKDVEENNCRRVFRSGVTHEEWSINWNGVEEDDHIENGGNRADADSDDDSNENASSSNKYNKSKNEDSSSETEEDRRNMKSFKSNMNDDQDTRIIHGKYKKKSLKHKSKDVEKSEEAASKSSPVSYESTEDENVNNPDSE